MDYKGHKLVFDNHLIVDSRDGTTYLSTEQVPLIALMGVASEMDSEGSQIELSEADKDFVLATTMVALTGSGGILELARLSHGKGDVLTFGPLQTLNATIAEKNMLMMRERLSELTSDLEDNELDNQIIAYLGRLIGKGEKLRMVPKDDPEPFADPMGRVMDELRKQFPDSEVRAFKL